MELKEMVCEKMNWIKLAHNMYQLFVSYKARKFLNS